MTNNSRVAAGIPTGGQFASNNRTEAAPGLLSIDDISIVILDEPDVEGGFDEIQSDSTGNKVYLRNGKLHNEAGPALCEPLSSDGLELTESAWINGQRLTPPDEGLYFSGMTEEEGVTVQVWACGDNTRVYVAPDGRTTFTRDGDIDRAGGPAITGGGRPDIWMRHDKVIDNPLPGRPTRVVRSEGNSARIESRGQKFDPDLTTAERAMYIRADIDKAMYAGVLGTDAGLLSKTKVTTLGKRGVPGKPQTLHVVYRPSGYSADTFLTRGANGNSELTDKGAEVHDTLIDIVNAHNQWEHGPGASDSNRAFNVTVEIVR